MSVEPNSMIGLIIVETNMFIHMIQLAYGLCSVLRTLGVEFFKAITEIIHRNGSYLFLIDNTDSLQLYGLVLIYANKEGQDDQIRPHR